MSSNRANKKHPPTVTDKKKEIGKSGIERRLETKAIFDNTMEFLDIDSIRALQCVSTLFNRSASAYLDVDIFKKKVSCAKRCAIKTNKRLFS